jgi:hypothetical protein
VTQAVGAVVNVVPVVLATRCLVGLGEGTSMCSHPHAVQPVRTKHSQQHAPSASQRPGVHTQASVHRICAFGVGVPPQR